MKLIKVLVTVIILAGVAGVGIVIAAPSNAQASMLMEKLHLAPLQPLANETLVTTGQLQAQLPKLGSVLGVKTEEIKKSPTASLPQKTLEYARYAYCQQVVKDYEGRMGITHGEATPSAKPKTEGEHKTGESPRPSSTPRPSSSPHPESPRPSSSPSSGRK